MRTKACLLLTFGFLIFAFSKAEANINWSKDYFDYNAQDQGGWYYNSSNKDIESLEASSNKSDANGNAENTDVASATTFLAGLKMASGAWGNSFQDSARDSGGATAYAYADNFYGLDNPLGVCMNGQNVRSFIDRPFTVGSTGDYTISASAVAPVDWSGTTSGAAAAQQPQLIGEVQIFQTDQNNKTTMLLDSGTFSFASLVSSPRQATITLVAGDSYQLVVALSSATDLGGESGQPGIVTSFNNLDQLSFAWLGSIDGNFNAGTETNPVTITASLSPAPALWQGATDLGSGWKWLDWFGYLNTGNSPWIYHVTHGWLYPFGTSADSIWFWDPGMNTFWWTSQTVYPYVYRASDNAWLFYEEGTSNPRWFYNYKTAQWEGD